MTKRTDQGALSTARTPWAPSSSTTRSAFRAQATSVGEDHVRLQLVPVHGKTRDPSKALTKRTRTTMVVGETLDIVLQGVEPAGRDDAGLPHAASKELPSAASASDHGRFAEEHRAYGRTEPLRQADAHRVEQRRDVGDRHIKAHGGVADAGAVQVQHHATLVTELAQLAESV